MFFKPNRKITKGASPLVLNVAPAPGFFAGTRIATRYAWTAVEDLQVGDIVLTAENGEQSISGIEHGELSVSSHAAAAAHWPLLVPEAVLGNDAPLMVSPATRLVIEHEQAAELFGQPRVSVRGESLIGYRGIARARVGKSLSHVTLHFEEPQTLVAHGSLFFDVPCANRVHSFMPLDARQARLLLHHMGEADTIRRATASPAGPNPTLT